MSYSRHYSESFLPRDAMHSADYAVARCPSVCLSHAGILSKRLNILNLFHRRVPTPYWLFHSKRYGNISMGTPKRRRRMQGGMKKSRFSTNISCYLRNDTR